MASLQHPQKDSWTAWNQFYTYLLLRNGTNPETVEKKIKPILARNLDPETAANHTPLLQPLTDIHLHSHLHREMTTNGDTTSLYVFSSIALLILAISCANFVSMSTAQASVRAKEIGVRKVNGAIRKQVALQFLTEAFIICFASLLISETIAFLCLPVLNELTGKNMTTSALIRPTMLGGAGAIAFMTALLAGIYPSLYQSALKPLQVLKGRFTSPGNVSVRKGLVVFQFALSSVLVIGSVIILQQLQYIRHKPLGFDPEQIITIPIQSDVLRSKYEVIKKELLSHHGVISVSLSGNLPGGSDWGIPSLAEGFTNENMPSLRVMAADADFVKTFGMTLVGGRNFSDELASDSTTYLINEEAARQLGWTDPLSKSISMPAVGRSQGSVIGVVKDFHFRSLRENIGGILFFVPPRSWYSLYSIKLDASMTKEALDFIEQKILSFDPDHPFTFSFFDESYSNLYQQETRLATIVGYFTAVGIFLACLGLYSLASFTAQQRTKEIGIRKVIGASAGQIVFMLSRQFLLLVTIGFVISVPAAWWVLQWWLQSFAYHVNFSVGAVVACGFLSIFIALSTVGYRAIRVAISNPVNALRNE
jgi:putative ABC transport system permease protein